MEKKTTDKKRESESNKVVLSNQANLSLEKKLESLVINNKKFLHLNDDCLFQIFNLLSLKELCVLSRVCKSLKILCENYFKKKYSLKWMNYETYPLYRNYIKKIEKDYALCFENCIKNIVIGGPRYGYPRHGIGEFVDFLCSIRSKTNAFYKGNAEKNYEQIIFHDAFFNNVWCEQPENINLFENLTTIGFLNCSSVFTDCHKQLSELCPKLKNLMVVIQDENWTEVDGELIQLRMFPFFVCEFPALERLQCTVRSFTDTKLHFSRFIQLNPTIKSLTCNFDDSDNIKEYLKAISNYGKSIEELFLSFRRAKLEDICSELEPLCERTKLKRLELDFRNIVDCALSDDSSFSVLNKLTGIHFKQVPFEFATICAMMPNLRSLHLGLHYNCYVEESNSAQLVKAMVKNLKHLEELVLSPFCSHSAIFFIPKSITPFVRYLTKLKSIIIDDINLLEYETVPHIPQLNIVRKKLQHACKLSIFIHERLWERLIQKKDINSISNDGLVYFKRISMTHYFLNVQDPFMQFYCDEM